MIPPSIPVEKKNAEDCPPVPKFYILKVTKN